MKCCASLALITMVPAAMAAEFGNPQLLRVGTEPLKVVAPGYACPTWSDWDGDGTPELLVGQFAKGAITIFKVNGMDAEGRPKLEGGKPLLSGDRPVEVPGVW